MDFLSVLGTVYDDVTGMMRRGKAKNTPAQTTLTKPQTTASPTLDTSVSLEHMHDSNLAEPSSCREKSNQIEQDAEIQRIEQSTEEYWRSENVMADLQRFLRSIDKMRNTSSAVPHLTSLVDYLLAYGFLDKSLPREWNRDAVMPTIYWFYQIDRTINEVTINRDAHKAWADFPRVFRMAELESAIKAGQTVGRPMNVMSRCFREQTYYGIKKMNRYISDMKESKKHICLETCIQLFLDELRDRLEAYPELLGFLRWHPLQ